MVHDYSPGSLLLSLLLKRYLTLCTPIIQIEVRMASMIVDAEVEPSHY